jgi:hypothetical protein
MRKARFWITIGCCIFTFAAFASAQTQKAGLWDVTTNMTWQQSPFPGGMSAPGGGAHTTQVCVTQEQINKFGGPPPQVKNGCQVTNLQKTLNGMTADLTCTGPMSGKGTVQGTTTADGQAKAKVHMAGTLQMGPNAVPFEWTVESTSTYKGPSCGNVKPIVMPEK